MPPKRQHVDAGVGGERPQRDVEARRRRWRAGSRRGGGACRARARGRRSPGSRRGCRAVPSSVVWVMDTASGWARCSSPQPQAWRSISSGVSLPSGRGHGQQLDAADPLRRAALVGVDVRGLGADHRPPARRHALQREHVRAGAVEHREDLDVRRRSAAASPPAGARCRRPRRRRSGGRRWPAASAARISGCAPGVVVGGEAAASGSCKVVPGQSFGRGRRSGAV